MASHADRFPIRRRSALAGGLAGLAGLLPGCRSSTTATRMPGAAGRYADRPAVMAIGDSLYQGVRSLTFTADLARHSAPAQVAACLNQPMLAPDPPRPILFDLEDLLRSRGLVGLGLTIRQACVENIGPWLTERPWSQHEAFDNVAIGGAQISSLYTDDFAKSWPVVQSLAAQLDRSPLPDASVVGPLWFALNTCFTLNPQRRDELAEKTQLDQVRDRKPALLLVNIGSNEGLARAVLFGALDQATLCSIRDVPSKMEPLADYLAALPKEVETIAFNSVVRPRCAPNLMPAASLAGRYPGDGYYPAYGPWLTDPTPRFTGGEVKDFDDLIRDVNEKVRILMARTVGPRLRYVDLYAASTSFDGKHYADRFLPVTAPDGTARQLRNVPFVRRGLFSAGGPFGNGGFDGGLAGLDDIHPTVPGYALVADSVLQAIGAQATTDKDAAFRNDTLLTRPPLFAPAAQKELRDLGAFGVFRRVAQASPSCMGLGQA